MCSGLLWWLLYVFFVFLLLMPSAVPGGQGLSRSGIPSDVATGCPLSVFLAGVAPFPVPLFPFIIFLSFGACTLSGRFWYLWQAFPFWRSFGRRLLSLAVMVLFYPSEYKKAVAICQRLKAQNH